jgi:hypothetical protein
VFTLSVSRHCRAGLQIVPSLRDWASPVGRFVVIKYAQAFKNSYCVSRVLLLPHWQAGQKSIHYSRIGLEKQNRHQSDRFSRSD